MDEDKELLRQIKRNIDEALRLADIEEDKVKDHRTGTRLKSKALNYDNIKPLLKTISRSIKL